MESLDIIMNTLIQTQVPAEAKLIISGSRAKMDTYGKLRDKDVIDKIATLVEEVLSTIKNNA